MVTVRVFVTVVLIEVLVPELPSDTRRIPLALPVVQKLVPSFVTALRKFAALYESEILVEVSTVPFASIRPTIRLVAELVVVATVAVPGAAS